jgi:carbon-monoxide dehydrogenase medium subunit
MKSFVFKQPRCLDETYDILDESPDNLNFLAGGTDLTVRLRHGTSTPGVVVDLKRISDLPSTIEERDGFLRIGASAVMSDIAKHGRVEQLFSALVESAQVVGSIQIRNRATLAGNICNASPAADTVPVLAAYNANVSIGSRHGSRDVSIVDFILGNRDIDLRQGEIVTAINIPLPKHACGSSFKRITRRRGVDLATISICCKVSSDGESIFALGAASPRPLVVADAGQLVGMADDTNRLAEKIGRLISCAKPISDIRASADYRLAMFDVIARRAFECALSRRDGAINV